VDVRRCVFNQLFAPWGRRVDYGTESRRFESFRARQRNHGFSDQTQRQKPLSGTNLVQEIRRSVGWILSWYFLIATTACSPWTPHDFPVRVDVGSDLNDGQRVALLDGIALLEERVSADVFMPVETNGRRIQRDRISVREPESPCRR
jgi:hypothetical protein